MKLSSIFNALTGQSGPPAMPPGASSSDAFAGVSKRSDLESAPGSAPTPPELRPGPAKPAPAKNRFDDVQIAPAGPVTLAHVLDVAGIKAAEPSEEKQLRDLQAVYDQDRKFLLAHLQDAADQAMRDHQKELTELLEAGKYEKAHDEDFWQIEAWRRDFRAKRESAEQHQRKLAAIAYPIVEKIVNRISEAAEKVAATLESEERALALEWGVPFQASLRLITVAQVPRNVGHWLPIKGTNFQPAEILKSLGRISR